MVWRRLLVPGAVHLGKLDLMVQAAMGWTNSHLHCFRIGKLSYGPVTTSLTTSLIGTKRRWRSRKLSRRNGAWSMSTTSATPGNTTWCSRTA